VFVDNPTLHNHQLEHPDTYCHTLIAVKQLIWYAQPDELKTNSYFHESRYNDCIGNGGELTKDVLAPNFFAEEP